MSLKVKTHTILSISLCFMVVSQGVSSQLRLQHGVCLVAMLLAPKLMNAPSGTVSFQ